MSELIGGKTAEFLNTKANYILQVLPEHAGDDHKSGLVRVPNGCHAVTKCRYDTFLFWMDCGHVVHSSNQNEKYKPNSKDFNSYLAWADSSILIWQRNTLQQKVDEVRQHLGITNNNMLSVMIGREKSYLRKLLKRNASSATVEKGYC